VIVFLPDEQIIIEVGGRSKDFKQIKDLNNAYLALSVAPERG